MQQQTWTNLLLRLCAGLACTLVLAACSTSKEEMPEAELIALDQVGLNHRFHARPPTLMPSTALASAASCWPSVLDELPTKSISRSMTLTVSCEGWANSAR